MRKSKIKHAIVIAAALLLPAVTGSTDAEAFSYGKRLANGKTCRVTFGKTHFHDGDGTDASKTSAQARALHGWARFVMFEYGRRWSKWSLAQEHSMACINDTDAGVWRCRAEAQPCKS